VRGRPANIVVNAVSPSAFTRLVRLNRGIINTRPGAPLPDAAIEFSRANSPTHLVAAGALLMMHETCPVTGKIFNVGTGRVGEVFVGVTRGYVSPDGELAPEDVLDHFDEVRDISESNVPVDIGAHGSWVRSVLADRANRAAHDASELHKALLTAPAVARSQRALRQSLTTALGARTVEVVILRHAAVTGNAYCWEHHLAPANAAGLSEAEIAAIKAGTCEALDESEVKLVGFVDSCLAGKDTSALRDALNTALGEPAVVQLAMLIGYYSMIGIARAALGVKTGST
jgi:AhpD family alkylhydroperoxidase